MYATSATTPTTSSKATIKTALRATLAAENAWDLEWATALDVMQGSGTSELLERTADIFKVNVVKSTRSTTLITRKCSALTARTDITRRYTEKMII